MAGGNLDRGDDRPTGMDSRLVSERITRMAWIDKVAIPLQDAVGNAFHVLGKTGEKVENFLHGKFLGHPLHPVTVHLPIGAWILAAILDPWGGSMPARVAADAAVGFGLFGAIVASITGATDFHPYGDPSVRRIGGLHAILNWVAIGLYAFSLLFRFDEFRDLARIFSYTGLVAVSAAGYLGGLLVYEKRIGVNHASLAEDEAAPEEDWVTVARFADLPEGRPVRANAGDVPLVLVRTGQHVDALANACSHQGGPLSEGMVENGCIECPWHQTRFDLSSGAVISGPCVFPQPVYPVRIVDGDVQVSAIMPEMPLEVETPDGRASMR